MMEEISAEPGEHSRNEANESLFLILPILINDQGLPLQISDLCRLLILISYHILYDLIITYNIRHYSRNCDKCKNITYVI
jgi:hypothetical protein